MLSLPFNLSSIRAISLPFPSSFAILSFIAEYYFSIAREANFFPCLSIDDRRIRCTFSPTVLLFISAFSFPFFSNVRNVSLDVMISKKI